MVTRYRGQIKFFNHSKGYGFIAPDDGSRDVFIHISAVQRAGIPHIHDGANLSYEIIPDRNGRGPQAIELQLLHPAQ